MKITGLYAVAAIFFSLVVLSASKASCFGLPEKLVYDLTWTGIEAGKASLEISRNGDTVTIVSTAKSADWVSFFYTVDDRSEAVLVNPNLSGAVGQPLNYRVKIREGRHRREREVTFDQEKHTARYQDHISGENREIVINGNTFDPLSAFYQVRRMKCEVGKSLFVDIIDGRKIWNVEVQVLRKERIKTKLGFFDTVVIKPLMKSEGIFNRKGDMYIWLTDDGKRLPVKMQAKAAVGSITATLSGGEF